jgi:hypothetical protein
MYQVIKHYHQNDYRYKSKAVKGKTLEETNQEIVCSFQHKSDVIIHLERSYGQDYKSGKNCFCQILDRENSKYVISEDDITKSQIELVFLTYNSPETKHVHRDGNFIITQISSAKTFEKEHFSVSVKFIEDDAEMMKHAEHIISLIQDVCNENGVTIKTSRQDYFNSHYWLDFCKLPKNMTVCPIDILMQKKEKFLYREEEHTITKTIYKIIIYKLEDTFCICLKGPNDTRIPLVKTEVVAPNTTWYEKYPSKHTNYVLSQANIDKIVEKLHSKNSALKTK